MKSTGVVRKIDDLGRIVIPKEIRRALRIKDGESFEILVDSEMIALKKISKFNNISEVSNKLAQTLSSCLNKSVFIIDCDCFIAASGSLKKKYIGVPISNFLTSLFKEKKYVIINDLVEIELLDKEKEYCSYIASPIIVDGNVIGYIIIISYECDLDNVDDNLIITASKFLEKFIEE